MNIVKKTAAGVLFGLMTVASATMPAWSAMPGPQSVTAATVAASNVASSAQSDPSWLEPEQSVINARRMASNCKPGRLFSQHDMVGDPESCIMGGRITVGSGSTVAAPAL